MARDSLKRLFSIHSSDTEECVTPRKRLCRDIGSPCPSENTPTSCRTIRVAPRKPHDAAESHDLYTYLRRCRSKVDILTIDEFKSLPSGKFLEPSIQSLLHKVKLDVKKNVNAQDRIIEIELYLRWLEGLDFVVASVETLLNAKIPGSRRRVPGLGSISCAILYRVIDGFISDVDHHHDGWSSRGSEEHPVYPVTMTLAEEANDPSTDSRAENATCLAEAALQKYDRVMEAAVRRLKAEGGRTRKLARKVAQMERSLARACCLLCEQTGLGDDYNGAGDSILESTRTFMRQWKAEYGITDDDDYDSQDES